MGIEREQKVAVVTGACGAIGSALVTALERDGIRVWAVDRVDRMQSPHKNYIRTVLGSDEGFSMFAVPEPRVDYVFHIAGGALPEEVAHDGLLARRFPVVRTFDDNVFSAINLLDAVGSLMVEGGSVTLTSSINALADYSLPVYSAAKAALHGLVASLAPTGAYAGRGVRLNAVVLGTVVHDGVRALHADQPGHFEALEAQTRDGVLLTPETAAEAFVRVGVEASDTTGEVIVVDNGQLAHKLRGRRPLASDGLTEFPLIHKGVSPQALTAYH